MVKLGAVAATIGAWVVLSLTALVGMMLVFSDLPPSESAASRIVKIALTYAIGCGCVGAMLPRAWYVAAVAALGPFLLAAVGLAGRLIQGGQTPHGSFLAAGLVFIPAGALASGYAGSRLRRKLVHEPAAHR